MARNDPDLPRREQRGTRQLMLCSAGLAIVLFAVVAASNGQLGGTSPAAAQSASTGVRANQGSGQSEAGKNDTVTPRPNSTVGSGQNSSGEAANIEQSAKPLQLSDAQRKQIRQYFATQPRQRMQSANFSLAIGSAVPQDVPLLKLPPEISSAMGGYRGDDYVLVGDQLVIVDPSARRVVALVPNVS